jgi:DNA-binding NtrC family response regulator
MMPQQILVVDDEPRVLAAMARCLRLAGFRVESAVSAQAALALCEENSFDVVVLDFIMPGTDGVELLARIRKVQPLVRAIVVSGQIDVSVGEEDIAKRLREAVEADHYLHKPVSCTLLVDTIKSVVTDSPATDWRTIARRMVTGKSASIQGARKTAKDLKKHRKN